MFQSVLNLLNSHELAEYLISSRFVLIVLVLFLIHLKMMTYSSMFLTALVNIPGTFLHETAHFTVGLLLNAKPTSFSLFPVKQGDAYVTGSVGFSNLHFYNALPSAIAPLRLLPVGYFFDKYFFDREHITVIGYIVYVLLQTIIIENALPSSADFKIGFGNLFGVAFYILIFFVVACLCAV